MIATRMMGCAARKRSTLWKARRRFPTAHKRTFAPRGFGTGCCAPNAVIVLARSRFSGYSTFACADLDRTFAGPLPTISTLLLTQRIALGKRFRNSIPSRSPGSEISPSV